MTSDTSVLLTLGALFLIGFGADALARRVMLPRVTLLLLAGMLLGPSVTGVVSTKQQGWLVVVAQATLCMVGFLLGGRLTINGLQRYGRTVLIISLTILTVSSSLMFGSMLWAGVPLSAAILFASICLTTDPVAPTDVIHELHADGPFTRILMGVIATNDALGFVLFTVALSVAALFHPTVVPRSVLEVVWELGGAVAIGALLGRLLAFVGDYIQGPDTLLAGTLGLLILCGAMATRLHTSFFLAVMIMGSVTVNTAQRPWKSFMIIERFLWPFLILFFLLAGANLKPKAMLEIGLISGVYLACRMLGEIIGGWLGATLSRSPASTRRWLGPALLPQAGVAMSMTFIAVQRFPDLTDLLLPVVISGVMVFELIGPVMTRVALVRIGENNGREGGPRLR
ncbi:MAG: cation:proton antiporter [Magnetococcales bacterium]|nr:cation:proton antiporter [Magnetococcales bacterium]